MWWHKLGSPFFGQFRPFLCAARLKLPQVEWKALVLSPEMLSWNPVWVLAGPLTHIHSHGCPEATPDIQTVCLKSSSCWEMNHRPHSELWSRFSNSSRMLLNNILAAWCNRCASSTGLVMRDAWSPPNMTQVNLGLTWPENFVSHDLLILLANLKAGLCLQWTFYATWEQKELSCASTQTRNNVFPLDVLVFANVLPVVTDTFFSRVQNGKSGFMLYSTLL